MCRMCLEIIYLILWELIKISKMKIKQNQVKNKYKNAEALDRKRGRQHMLKEGTLSAKERSLLSFTSDQWSDNT